MMLEDATMKKMIREKGQIESVSGVQDTYRGQLTISAVFGEENKKFFPSLLGTVPPTGTSLYLVTDSILDTLLAPYRDMIIYLGQVYGSTPHLPLWFKHFGRGKNGAGEAYHIGVFGKTGSGKSVLSKTILLSYARHPETRCGNSLRCHPRIVRLLQSFYRHWAAVRPFGPSHRFRNSAYRAACVFLLYRLRYSSLTITDTLLTRPLRRVKVPTNLVPVSVTQVSPKLLRRSFERDHLPISFALFSAELSNDRGSQSSLWVRRLPASACSKNASAEANCCF